MIDTQTLHKVFAEKLLKTGSMDDALTKVTWIAYKAGVEDGMSGIPAQKGEPSEQV